MKTRRSPSIGVTAVILLLSLLSCRPFPPGQPIEITYIHMISSSEGWSIGGINGSSDHVFRTSDGGLIWRDVTPPEPAPQNPEDKKEVTGFFKNNNFAWVIYFPQSGFPAPEYAVVWYTQDGGTSWKASLPLDSSLFVEMFIPSDMQFIDNQNGWFLVHMGAGMNHDYIALLASKDGGATWQVLFSPYHDGGIQSCSKTGMVFTNTQTGWLTSDCHGVRTDLYLDRTNDGGVTWEEISLPTPADPSDLLDEFYCGLESPLLFSPGFGLFALVCPEPYDWQKTAHAYVYSTSDGGTNWQIYPYSGGDLIFMDHQNGLAVSRTIYNTKNGGQTWTFVKEINWDGQFSFTDASHGWAVARNEELSVLVKTTNGGSTWEEIRPQVAP